MDFEKMIAYVEEHKAEYFAKLLNRGGIGMNSDKIHVLKDESLSGIEREYVEVNRKAEVGEKIAVTAEIMLGEDHFGEIHAVTKIENGLIETDGKWDDGSELNMDDKEYNVLEPTDIVHIDGAKYRMVDRKAEVGEKVIVVNGYGGALDEGCYNNGDIFIARVNDPDDILALEGTSTRLFHSEYHVLEPVDSADELTTVDESDASPQVLDLLANLARRVTSLEQQLRDTQGNVEKFAEQTEANTQDIATLDERTQPTDIEALQTTIRVLCEHIGGERR